MVTDHGQTQNGPMNHERRRGKQSGVPIVKATLLILMRQQTKTRISIEFGHYRTSSRQIEFPPQVAQNPERTIRC
jgi:hypothetical protein